jgi:uncharacterized protein DUF397
MEEVTWRKSSRSTGGANNCVDIRADLGAVRDSKNPSTTMRIDVKEFVDFFVRNEARDA